MIEPAGRKALWKTQILALALGGALLAGCASKPDQPQIASTDGGGGTDTQVAAAPSPGDNDPLEFLNRNIFAINLAVDTVILEPAADIYRHLVPDGTQRAVRNLLRYVKTPIILVNNLLQGDTDGAANTMHRFFINSITLGLDDPAAIDGYQYQDTGFGDTLAVWGVGEGFYVVLPIFGPSTARDAVGLGADILADPLTYTGTATTDIVQGTATGLDERSRNIDGFRDIQRNSLDFYAAVRSLYRQRRASQIRSVTGETGPGPGGSGASDLEWDLVVAPEDSSAPKPQ